MAPLVSNNKRIAKNTILLYLRTFVVLLINLYCSRLILKALGVVDMGIYNVVGGIVTLMAVLQNAQSIATGRFIMYDIGKNLSDAQKSRTFSVCMTIHLLIALIVVVLGETLGLYIINSWTSIPESRTEAANIVYQLSLLTFVINIIRVPYNSVVIAYEEMDSYAFMTILETGLKLLFVYMIVMITADHLIVFAASLTTIAVIILLLYIYIVKRKHPEYKYSLVWDKQKSFKVLTFSGWTLTSSTANTFTQQGVSLLFNNFVGLVANAALGFAYQINGAVYQFVSSFSTAFNPQIVKLWSSQNKDELYKLMNRASKFSFILAYLFALPLMLNIDFILKLWLHEVPQFTQTFSLLIVICSVIDATTGVYNTAITATGKIKDYQICISISFLLDLLVSFILLYFGFHPAMVFGSRIVTRGLLNMVIGLYFTKKLIGFDVALYIKEVLLPVIITILASIPLFLFEKYIEDNLTHLVITFFTSLSVISICSLYVIMTKSERQSIILFINKIKNRA